MLDENTVKWFSQACGLIDAGVRDVKGALSFLLVSFADPDIDSDMWESALAVFVDEKSVPLALAHLDILKVCKISYPVKFEEARERYRKARDRRVILWRLDGNQGTQKL